jgi:hypothetical protein
MRSTWSLTDLTTWHGIGQHDRSGTPRDPLGTTGVIITPLHRSASQYDFTSDDYHDSIKVRVEGGGILKLTYAYTQERFKLNSWPVM